MLRQLKQMASEISSELHAILKGDPDACSLALLVWELAHLWDDLVDRDRTLGPEDVHRAFEIALFALPAHPLYQRHFNDLQLLLKIGYANWRAANDLERLAQGAETLDPRPMEVAHVLRHKLADVYIYLAGLVGGPYWANENAARIWMIAHNESFAEYIHG
jgi:hypothetical protein